MLYLESRIDTVKNEAIKNLNNPISDTADNQLISDNLERIIEEINKFTEGRLKIYKEECLKKSPFLKEIEHCKNLTSLIETNIISNQGDLSGFYGLAESCLNSKVLNTEKDIVYKLNKLTFYGSSNSSEIENCTSQLQAIRLAMLSMVEEAFNAKEQMFENFFICLYEEELKRFIEFLLMLLKASNAAALDVGDILSNEYDKCDLLTDKEKFFIEGMNEYLNSTAGAMMADELESLNVKDSIYQLTEDLEKQFKGRSSGEKDKNQYSFKSRKIDSITSCLAFISKNQFLIELINKLGRDLGLDNRSNNMADDKRETRESVNHNLKENLTGICLSDDIEYAFPQELSLLTENSTSIIFDLKFIEKRIQCFDLEGISLKNCKIHKQSKSYESQRGPVIICYDTSGSMKGYPEKVAKAVVMVLALRCLKEKRCAYLINFSTAISTFLCSFSDNHNQTLDDLKKFLLVSFNGNTDLDEALNESIKIIRDNPTFNKSDFLCITDSFFDCNAAHFKKEFNKLRKNNGTRFYELIIGNDYIEHKDLFDEEYHLEDPTVKECNSIIDIDRELAKLLR